MKTNKFGKLIALVLCAVMAFSVSATAFAAGPSEVDTWNVNSEVTTVDAVENLAIAESTVSTTIPAYSWQQVYVGALTAGQIIRVQASWTPTSNDLYIGLLLSGSEYASLSPGSGGNLDKYATIPEDGEYYVLFENLTSTALTLTDWTITVYNP